MAEKMYGYNEDDTLLNIKKQEGPYGTETYKVGKYIYYVGPDGQWGRGILAMIRVSKTGRTTYFKETGTKGQISTLPFYTSYIYDTLKKVKLHLKNVN